MRRAVAPYSSGVIAREAGITIRTLQAPSVCLWVECTAQAHPSPSSALRVSSSLAAEKVS